MAMARAEAFMVLLTACLVMNESVLLRVDGAGPSSVEFYVHNPGLFTSFPTPNVLAMKVEMPQQQQQLQQHQQHQNHQHQHQQSQQTFQQQQHQQKQQKQQQQEQQRQKQQKQEEQKEERLRSFESRIIAFDNVITAANAENAPVLGRAHGIRVVDKVGEGPLAFTWLFTASFNASSRFTGTLSFQGTTLNFPSSEFSDVTVTGGTGSFRFARGYATFTNFYKADEISILEGQHFQVFLRY